MGIKSDKTFEEIVERLAALVPLVGQQPADQGAKADSREDPASDQSKEKNAQPSSKSPFDQKKR